jgi:hypothetical protein
MSALRRGLRCRRHRQQAGIDARPDSSQCVPLGRKRPTLAFLAYALRCDACRIHQGFLVIPWVSHCAPSMWESDAYLRRPFCPSVHMVFGTILVGTSAVIERTRHRAMVARCCREHERRASNPAGAARSTGWRGKTSD